MNLLKFDGVSLNLQLLFQEKKEKISKAIKTHP